MVKHNSQWFLAGLLFLAGCHTPAVSPLVQDFLADTASITGFTLTDGTDTSLIRREGYIWYCNGQRADEKEVKRSLLNLRRLQLHSPADFGKSKDQITDVEIWIYKRKKELHLNLTDQEGYTLLVYPDREIAQQVFLPGSPLPIARRIPVSPNAWAVEKLLPIDVATIQSISLRYPYKENCEWRADKKGGNWYLETSEGSTAIIDPEFMSDYLYAFPSLDARLATSNDTLRLLPADTLALLTILNTEGQKLSLLAQGLKSPGHKGTALINQQYVVIKVMNSGNCFITKYIDFDLVFIPAESWLLIKK